MSVPHSGEAVRVVVRCRPMSDKEITRGHAHIVAVDTSIGTVEITAPGAKLPKSFTFDSAYGPEATQLVVYEETAYALVESVFDGFNCTIFAYGQTGCGKTHTMTGGRTHEQSGIIPRSFEHIFENIAADPEAEFLVRASYIEIYNEDIHDLLAPDPKAKLDLKEGPSGVYVKDLTTTVISDMHRMMAVTVEINHTGPDGNDHFRCGKLSMVDLAGSERQDKTGATGIRLKEGCKINLSLSALGNVISALVDGKGKHIPYRDSKLTRLLQDSLGGNSKTVMMAAIGPADVNYNETLSTLRYASRAKKIKNKPIVNEDPKDALLRQYKEEIEKLRRMISETQTSPGPRTPQRMPTGSDAPHTAERVVIKRVEVVREVPVIREVEVVREVPVVQRVEVPVPIHQAANGAGQGAPAVFPPAGAPGSALGGDQPDAEALRQKLEDLVGQVIKPSEGGTSEQLHEARERGKKKKAEMRAELRRRREERKAALREAQEARRLLRERIESAEAQASSQQAAMEAQRSMYEARLDQATAEIRDLQAEFERERSTLLDTIREQNKELGLLLQLADLFLPPHEMSKVWERSIYNEATEEWKLPRLRPRSRWTRSWQGTEQVKLPVLLQQPQAQARTPPSSASSATPLPAASALARDSDGDVDSWDDPAILELQRRKVKRQLRRVEKRLRDLEEESRASTTLAREGEGSKTRELVRAQAG